MPTGCFGKVLVDVSSALIRQADTVSYVYAEILTQGQGLPVHKDRPHYICASAGSACLPSCNSFRPGVICRFARLDLSYRTFAHLFWEFRSTLAGDFKYWRRFYRCFHPEDNIDKEKQFKAEFPHDVPILSNMEARSNYDVGKHLSKEEPGYWSEYRLKAATSGSDLEKRMASVDWDWKWYEWATVEKGLKIDLTIARNKVDFDKIMSKIFGDDYEDDGHYDISVDHPEFIRLKGLYIILKDFIKNELNFTPGQKAGGTRNLES